MKHGDPWQQLAFDECRRAIEGRLAQRDRHEVALRDAAVDLRFHPAILGLQAIRVLQFTTAVGMLAEVASSRGLSIGAS